MVAFSCRVKNLHLPCFLSISGKKFDDDQMISGRGCLTNVWHDVLQSFYSNALWANKGKPLKTRAISKHYWKTYEKPQHKDCPTEPNSWCSFQKNKTLHQSTYKPVKNLIPVSIQKVIQPLFEKLSNPALSDCSNANESYHHILWGLALKEQYTSSEAIHLVVQLSVCLNKSGFYSVYSRTLARCKLPYLICSLPSFPCIDNRRIANTHYREQDRVKYNRKKEQRALNKQADAFVRKEGIQYKQGELQGKPK